MNAERRCQAARSDAYWAAFGAGWAACLADLERLADERREQPRQAVR